MNSFRADIHIHTVLSPCGDLYMSPINIIKKAKEMELDIIGITDHNSTKQCLTVKKLGNEYGIFTLCGAEITTKEEIHSLVYFKNEENLNAFQNYIDEHLPFVENDVNKLGYQLIVDEDENVIVEEERSLYSALDISIDNLADEVHRLNGIFIPAHVNKSKNSIISQLGFVPPTLKADGYEISRHISKEDFLKTNSYLNSYTFISNSDAHAIADVGSVTNTFYMNELSFEEIKRALLKENGREIIIN